MQYGLQGKASTKDIQRGIVAYMRSRGVGVDVSHDDIERFIFDTYGITFSQISHVLWALRKADDRILKGDRGFSRLVEGTIRNEEM